MGILDMGKMAMKARKAQSQMKKLKAVGQSKSGSVAVMINGLNDLEEVNFDYEDGIEVDAGFLSDLEKDFIQAFEAAKKDLEGKMRENMDLDSVKDMLGL